MSILTPGTLTVEQRQAQTKDVIVQSTKQLFAQMKNTYNVNFNFVWNNKNLTPQQVVDGFGTDATDIFTLAFYLKSLLNSLVPDTITSEATMDFVLNEDGTVTLSDIPSSSSSDHS